MYILYYIFMRYIIVYYIILHTYIHVLGNGPFPVTVTRIIPFLGSGIPHSSSPATITAGICIEKYARRPSKWLHSSEPQIFGILKIPNKFHWNLPPPSLVWVPPQRWLSDPNRGPSSVPLLRPNLGVIRRIFCRKKRDSFFGGAKTRGWYICI